MSITSIDKPIIDKIDINCSSWAQKFIEQFNGRVIKDKDELSPLKTYIRLFVNESGLNGDFSIRGSYLHMYPSIYGFSVIKYLDEVSAERCNVSENLTTFVRGRLTTFEPNKINGVNYFYADLGITNIKDSPILLESGKTTEECYLSLYPMMQEHDCYTLQQLIHALRNTHV